jgi:hypothetical protein
MKKRLIFFPAALALLLVVASCDSATAPSRPLSLNQLKAEGLRVFAVISRPSPGTMSFRVGVENRTTTEMTLHFTDGQFFDIEVTDRGGDLVWRWSHDKAFTQALWALELKAGESFAQDAEWDLTGNNGKPLSPGTYMARFIITSSPRDEALVLELPLTI